MTTEKDVIKEYRVNQKGLDKIKEFLMIHHRNFIYMEPDRKQLYACAQDAEMHLELDDEPYIEINSFDSVINRSIILVLSESDYEVIKS